MRRARQSSACFDSPASCVDPPAEAASTGANTVSNGGGDTSAEQFEAPAAADVTMAAATSQDLAAGGTTQAATAAAVAAAFAATEHQTQQEVEEAAEYDHQEEDLGAEDDELSGELASKGRWVVVCVLAMGGDPAMPGMVPVSLLGLRWSAVAALLQMCGGVLWETLQPDTPLVCRDCMLT